jgi:hypothetical protein
MGSLARTIVGVGVIALAVVGFVATAESATPASPPTPANCTFSTGVTTCSTTSNTSGIVTVTVTNTGVTSLCEEFLGFTVTSYTAAHHGAPNSNGKQITPPPSVTSTSTVTSRCLT